MELAPRRAGEFVDMIGQGNSRVAGGGADGGGGPPAAAGRRGGSTYGVAGSGLAQQK